MREPEYSRIQHQLEAIRQVAEKIKKEVSSKKELREIEDEADLIDTLILDVELYLYEAHGFLSEEKQIYDCCVICRYFTDEPCRKCVNESEFRPIGDLTHSVDK